MEELTRTTKDEDVEGNSNLSLGLKASLAAR
jgi:hypothetical protein